MTLRRKQVFLLLSVALMLADGALLGMSYFNARMAFRQALREQGEQSRAGFDVAYAATLSSMLQMATFIGNDTRIQDLFLAGKRAVEAEGGGAGGPEAMHWRQALFEEVSSSWQRMPAQFDVRQLHFHLAPGSLSFLRVHKPEKFGDRMDDVRYTIVDTNNELIPRTGFETGRVYSGLRGVVPVWAMESGQRVHVGAVEVGTSFKEIYRVLDRQLGTGAATLLRRKHVEENMWQASVRSRFEKLYQSCDCVIEAASRPGIDAILNYYADTRNEKSPFSDFHSEHISVDGKELAVTYWPLFDYYGLSRNTGEQIGAIVMWRDISTDVAAFSRSMWINLLIAISGFLLLEILIYWTIRLITRRLEEQVALRTRELNYANERLASLAQTDELTGLNNRRHFSTELAQEVERAHRLGEPLSLAMADLDHFKSVNDQYGHLVGDHVLQVIAGLMRRNSRDYDVLGRYGGEELIILFPETGLEMARQVSERLREAIDEVEILAPSGKRIPMSISIGVAQLQPGEHADELVDAADKLLYIAKQHGRNRVCTILDDCQALEPRAQAH